MSVSLLGERCMCMCMCVNRRHNFTNSNHENSSVVYIEVLSSFHEIHVYKYTRLLKIFLELPFGFLLLAK